MDYLRLGRSGLQVSPLTLGAMGFGSKAWRPWVLEEEEARPIVKRALDLGINMIDTCDYYSSGESEALLGRLLNGTIARADVLIATKFGSPMGTAPNQRGYSRKHVMEAVDASLRRLGVDHIDLYQTHIWDHSANLEELVHALADVVRSGKALYVGATDIPTWQVVKAVYIAKAAGLAPFISAQQHYNLLWREAERELIPFCRSEGLGLLPYSPHARGILSGRQRRTGATQTLRATSDPYALQWYGRDCDRLVAKAVEDLAGRRGVSPSQIALAWVLHQPGVQSSIFGASTVHHVEEAVAALDINLDQEELAALRAAYQPRERDGHQ